MRLNTTELVAAFTTTPPFSVQVAGVVTHAGPPTMSLYHEPALGFETLKSRWNVPRTSATVTALPLENLMPLRRVNV